MMCKAHSVVLIALSALICASLQAEAATRNCTSALVTGGLCRVSTNKLISYDLPAAAATELADAVAGLNGCAEATATTCTTTCTATLINGGACSAGQLGTAVTISKASFADATLRSLMVALVRQWREEQAVAPARTSARATADPDISN